MIARRLDLENGVMLVEGHPLTILLDIPHGRLPLAGLPELNRVIGELMELREELMEGSTFEERGQGHA